MMTCCFCTHPVKKRKRWKSKEAPYISKTGPFHTYNKLTIVGHRFILNFVKQYRYSSQTQSLTRTNKGNHLSDKLTFSLNQLSPSCLTVDVWHHVLFLLLQFHIWVLMGFCRSNSGLWRAHHLLSSGSSQTCWHRPAHNSLWTPPHNTVINVTGARTSLRNGVLMVEGKKQTRSVVLKIQKSIFVFCVLNAEHDLQSEQWAVNWQLCVSTW